MNITVMGVFEYVMYPSCYLNIPLKILVLWPLLLSISSQFFVIRIYTFV